ncbi:unnamed protein product, partial [Timema podura]|nr:unnamed protein product [Timema podura]
MALTVTAVLLATLLTVTCKLSGRAGFDSGQHFSMGDSLLCIMKQCFLSSVTNGLQETKFACLYVSAEIVDNKQRGPGQTFTKMGTTICKITSFCKRHESLRTSVMSEDYLHSYETSPVSYSSRMVYLLALLISVVAAAGYSGALISSITIRHFDMPFSDLESLQKDGSYTLGAVSGSAEWRYLVGWRGITKTQNSGQTFCN